MKLIEEKIVKIGDKEYPVKLTVRAMIHYESLSGHSVAEIISLSDVTKLFYCAIKAGGLNISYDEFMDLIDDDPEALRSFSELMVEPVEKKNQAR